MSADLFQQLRPSRGRPDRLPFKRSSISASSGSVRSRGADLMNASATVALWRAFFARRAISSRIVLTASSFSEAAEADGQLIELEGDPGLIWSSVLPTSGRSVVGSRSSADAIGAQVTPVRPYPAGSSTTDTGHLRQDVRELLGGPTPASPPSPRIVTSAPATPRSGLASERRR
jgi:hypothetical protein